MAVPHLVREAVTAGRNPGYQLRLLGIVEKIAAPLGIDEFLSLTMALHMVKDEQVRAAIARIIVARNYDRQEAPAVSGAPSTS